jgi:hypothetical protein
MITRKQDNINAALDYIRDHPETHYQESWHEPCGTKHCFAGHGELRETGTFSINDSRHTCRAARMHYGFTSEEAEYYFSGGRTTEELETARLPWFAEDGYDRDGLDKDNNPRTTE